MVMQKQTSALAKSLGAQIVKAHAQHKDAPVDTRVQRLPGGINNGIAQLVSMTIGSYKTGTHTGKPFFRAAGTVIEPHALPSGQRVAGQQTSVMIPLCDTPEKRTKKTFMDNWADFLNVFKIFQVDMPPDRLKGENDQQAADRIEQYFIAAMKTLTAPDQKPYFTFSTRDWTPPKEAGRPDPTPMTFETWHDVVEYNGQAQDPSAGVEDGGAEDNGAGAADDANSEPGGDDIAALVEAAGVQDEGAIDRLTQLALDAGVDQTAIDGAADWQEVADLISAASTTEGSSDDEEGAGDEAAATPEEVWEPKKGDMYGYQLLDKNGKPLLNKAKKPLKPVECEVVSVDKKTETVALLNMDDKKTKYPKVKWTDLQSLTE